MTGALLTDIWNSANFSASVAPSKLLSVLYWILGILAAIAYKLGNCFPLRRKSVRKPQSRLCNESPQTNTINTQPHSLFVVIPAFIRTSEELNHIQLAIDNLERSPNIQAILVDDASPIMIDLTGCFVFRHPTKLGPAAARNTGIALALSKGATSIAFTDADCLPLSNWASAHAKLQQSSPGIWAGRTLAYNVDLISQFHNQVGTLMPRLSNSLCTEALYAPTCNLSVSADVASKLRFDSEFPTSAFEDCDFCVRARYLGHSVRVSSTPVVRHRFKSSLFGLLRSYFKYGRSFPIMLQKHPGYESMLESSRPMSLETWRNME